jgi:WD40 repeat protein
MTTQHEIVHLLPTQLKVCFVIRQFFTLQECQTLLPESVKESFQKAVTNYPTSYRNNDRFVIDNNQLARQLFDKVKPYLPSTVTIESDNVAESGVWKLQELNSRIRYCRYSSGQYFSRHLDGVYYRSQELQSKLTFMVYLNGAEDFTGGRTLFYQSKNTQEIWMAYTPQQGDLIVFDHNLWHEGEALQSGEKFVLRSDILYQRVEAGKPTASQDAKAYQEGHLGYIWKLLFLDEKTLISGGRDKIIKVWDADGMCIQQLEGHQNSVLCFAKLTNGLFLSGSRDRSIRAWQNREGRFCEISKYYFHKALVLSLCRIDDQTFASSDGDELIHVATLSGQILRTLRGHTDWIWNVILLEKTWLASCSEDKTLKIWNYVTGQCLATFEESSPVHCLVSSPSGEWLISGNYAGEISIRKKGNSSFIWQFERIFQAHQGIIRTLLLLTDTTLVSGGEDNKIKVCNLQTGTCLTEYTHQNFVQSVVLNSDNQLVSASYDGKIQVWKI